MIFPKQEPALRNWKAGSIIFPVYPFPQFFLSSPVSALQRFHILRQLVGKDRTEESGRPSDEEVHGGDYNAIAGAGARMKRVTAAGVEDNNMKGRKALAQRVVLNYNKNNNPDHPFCIQMEPIA